MTSWISYSILLCYSFYYLILLHHLHFFFFFFNDTATTEIYTLSLHDALPILSKGVGEFQRPRRPQFLRTPDGTRSEEHTSELQSQSNLVCRLLLEKKKNNTN